MNKSKISQTLRDWALVASMIIGVAAYLIYSMLDPAPAVRHFAAETVAVVQPVLIFLMLLLTFCKVDLRHLRLCRWHGWLLLIQCGLFCGIGSVLALMPRGTGMDVVMEGAMICLICPTATAAAVITRKLGGSMEHITTYTILINLAASMLIPAILPYVHPNPGVTTLTASLLILGKVFPLLLLPLVCGMLIRQLLPKLRDLLVGNPDMPFYIWMVSLSLALAVTARSIAHSTVPLSVQAWLMAVSLACCAFQFWAGRKIGGIYDDKISAGQALGQKNTVFAIWLGYTFFTPVTSIAGGFYSIWHNVVNSWQLYRHHKANP